MAPQNIEQLVEKVRHFPSTSDAKDAVLNSNADIIHSGAARIVIPSPQSSNYIFKIGVGQGIKQNRNEVRAFQHAQKVGADDLLLPILSHSSDYSWIKMPRVDAPEPGFDKYHGPRAKQVSEELKENGIVLHEIETWHYNGNSVAIDYGAVKEIENSP